MPIADLCDGKNISIPKGTTVQKAAATMLDKHIGCLVVVDSSEKPIGILTDRDIVLKAVAKDAPVSSTPVDKIMSTKLVTVNEGAGVYDAIKAMGDKGVRRLLVVDNSNKLCGVLSSDDLVKLVGEEMNSIGSLYQRQIKNEQLGRAHSA